jgi:hypothetical protein
MIFGVFAEKFDQTTFDPKTSVFEPVQGRGKPDADKIIYFLIMAAVGPL